MRRPRILRLRAALLVAAYVLGVLVALEGVARAVLTIPGFLDRVENDHADVSWRLHWFRREGHKTGIYYRFDTYHPVRGWAVTPNLRDVAAFPGARVSSNSRGVRGRREHAQPKPRGVVRLLVLGDSFTFGDEVSDDETYAADLERMLPDAEVVNLGVHGYGHDQMLLYLREVGARYQPDVVLLGFVYADMERNLLGFRDFAKPRFALVDGRLVLRGVPVPTLEALRDDRQYGLRLLDLVTLLDDDLTEPRRPQRAREAERLTAALLDEIVSTVHGLGAAPLLVYLPIEGEIGWPDVGPIEEERFLVRYARERRVPSLDLRPAFMAAAARGVRFKTYGHWTPVEHRLAAEAIQAHFATTAILPPRAGPSARAAPVSRGSRGRAPPT